MITMTRLKKAYDSDICYSFRNSPITVVSTVIALILIAVAILASFVAPFNPLDLAQIDLLDALTPPIWDSEGDARYLLGTDNQGRDMLSTIIYGMRTSLLVGFASVAFSMVVGVTLGLISGYVGGIVDAFIMRIAEIQLSIPAILVALLIDGVFRGILPKEAHESLALYVLVFSIGISNWVQFARTVRSSTMVVKNREYVQAAKITGRGATFIMFRHVLPNTMGPVLVIATISLAIAVITEATLSYLGVGLPPTEPSLGTLIRVGGDFLFAGEWWICIFPGLALVLLALSVNLIGDWLRDALNPRLR